MRGERRYYRRRAGSRELRVAALLRSTTVFIPRMRLTRRLLPFLLLTACGEDSLPERREGTLSIADSIRIRRNEELRRRPDTLGARVDSLRILGAPTAALWLVVVSDFQCAACRDFATNVLPVVRRDYVDAGVVRLAFVNFPQESHFNARFAAHAALCAGTSGRFWETHDTLFASLARWERLPDPQPLLDSLAVSAGAAPGTQRECRAALRMLNLLTGDVERSRKAGVTTVPTLLVGDRRLSGRELELDIIRRVIDDALRSGR